MTDSNFSETPNTKNENHRNERRRSLAWSKNDPTEISASEQKRYDKYMAEEERNWDNLWQELKSYKEHLRTSDVQLAKGLDISRQPVVDFMSEDKDGTRKRKDLPIYRANLIRLWDFLTSPEQIAKRKLPKEVVEKREQLRKEGPDRLLRLAGFIPHSHSLTIDGEPFREQKLYRIVSRLSSSWIPEKNIWAIEDAILNAILRQSSDLEDSGFSKNLISVEEKGVRSWLIKKYKNIPDQRIEKIESTTNSYAKTGKVDFEESELFELYQSIVENEVLRNQDGSAIKLRIVDCEFKNLTLLFDEFAQNEDFQLIIKKIKELGYKTENEIGVSLDSSTSHANDLEFLPVKEAVITWRIGENKSIFRWRYSSTAPHIENMLMALHHGLGDPPLKLCGLSLRALGKRANSLARISVSLTHEKNKNIYHGLWVDHNTITCLSQAVVVAVESWIIDTISNPTNYSIYCNKFASILHGLYEARQLLSDYQIHPPEDSFNFQGANKSLISVLEDIKTLKTDLSKESTEVQESYREKLYCHEQMAKLMLARSAHIEGRLAEAADYLYGEHHQDELNNNYIPISLLYAAEDMIHKFFSGEKEFLYGKHWHANVKFTLTSYKEKLKKYIVDRNKSNNLFDFDLHLCIAEIFGNLGRLDFYFSNQVDERNHLEEAINNFLVAVYFSSKIGNKQRVAHWLTHVSRAYSRLGKKDQSTQYAKFAEKLLTLEISPKHSSDYREAIMSEVNLAKGEQCLIENQYKDAIRYFLKSLSGALYLNFVRLIADSLYGISRATKLASDQQDTDKFEHYFSELRQKLTEKTFKEDNLDTANPEWENNSIYREKISFLKNVKENANWDSVSRDFKDEAKKIWHNWAKANVDDNTNHPVEDAIERGNFLSRLDSGDSHAV